MSIRVLVAGASGAIGEPLVRALLEAGHRVSALSRSEARSAALRTRDVEPHLADVFDRRSLIDAVAAARPEVVIDQLTALPHKLDLRRYREALAPTNRLRREVTPLLIEAARAAGARRLIVQSISFLTAPVGAAVHDEDAAVYGDAPLAFRDAVAAAVEMERLTLEAGDLSPVVLRYGFFYGPGTHYAADGAVVSDVRRRRFPLVGAAGGVTSFIHVEDAAAATVAALAGGTPGLYNVTDDEPAPLRTWLPAAAELLGAKPPRRVPVWVARLGVGAHAVHFTTTLRGNSNGRFKSEFGWAPTRPSWHEGFRQEWTARGSR